jgi:ATP-dependent RNA helicase RhlE
MKGTAAHLPPARLKTGAGRYSQERLPREANVKFEELNLLPPILEALKTEGYEEPTAIQEQAIPLLLKGRDLLGCAQTGTGKTAAFAIPILQLLHQEKQEKHQRAAQLASGQAQTGETDATAGQTPVAGDAPTGSATTTSEESDGEAHAASAGLSPMQQSDRGGRQRRGRGRRKEGAGRSPDAGSNQVDPIRALILTPTRELALQIEESFLSYGKNLPLRISVVYGGVSQANQTAALQKGVDILVATPGRLLDLVEQRYVNLHHIRLFVLDEADRMLDMGFAPDVRRIVSMLPKIRQTMLFSATMPQEIMHLVDTVLEDPVEVSVTPVSSAVDTIDQYVYHLTRVNKRHLLVWLLEDPAFKSVLVFSRTKHGAERIYKELKSEGISVESIHGDKNQQARQTALNLFKMHKVRVLVATDIAARGIDVDDISHVINYDMPDLPETYVHRIGRTGRAGNTGTSLVFCEEDDKPILNAIRRRTGSDVKTVYSHPFNTEDPDAKPAVEEKKIPFAGSRVKRRGYGRGRSFG